MCTICNAAEFERKIAETDIPCYKFMRFEDGEYYTPYYNMQMKIGERYDNKGEEIIKDEVLSLKIWWRDWNKYKEIKQGFFHSFVDYYSADYYAQLFNKNKAGNFGFYIIECVIPKESQYIVGFDLENNLTTYSSKSIVLKKKAFPH